MSERISDVHIVVLKVICEHYAEGNTPEDNPVTQRMLLNAEGGEHTGLVNEWIRRHGVSPRFTPPLTSTATLVDGIGKWREAGMMEPAERYVPTEKAYRFFEAIGDDWRRWPLSIPIRSDGSLDLENAQPQETNRE